MTKIFRKPLALVACTAMAMALATPAYPASSLPGKDVRLVKAGDAYSRTSVNTAVFRGSSVISHGDSQYISYYDKDGYVVLGKRDISDKEWQLHRTQYKGKISDAHNVISIGVDGDGFLHVSFDHHGNRLRYARSVAPGSLILGEMSPMLGGDDENDVTYPEFYSMPGGDLIFAYRSGRSGQGNLVLNRYSVKKKEWSRLHDVLIDGEGKRNAYWQMYVDPAGIMHLSWVWRETWLVETNHDLCYARSRDGGKTWERSDGSKYSLPITMDSAEVAWEIPQNSELINQTSMTADSSGRPYIATYWRDSDSNVPQYRLVWHDGKAWNMNSVGSRTQPFSLSGGGTKMIPIARPRIACDGRQAYYIFRDSERGSRVSVAYTPEIGKTEWDIADLTDFSVDAWEPSFDTNLWNRQRKLHIYVQTSHQGDGERIAEAAESSSPAYILEISR